MPPWPPSSGRRSALSAPRVVLDTQVFLRGAVARTESLTARIYEAWLDGRFTLLASEPTLAEVDAVLRRTEVLRKLDVTVLEARALIALLRRKATVVTPTVTIRRSRDPDDDKFLECAVAGAADALVTADADLLTLRAIEGIPILDIPRAADASAPGPPGPRPTPAGPAGAPGTPPTAAATRRA